MCLSMLALTCSLVLGLDVTHFGDTGYNDKMNNDKFTKYTEGMDNKMSGLSIESKYWVMNYSTFRTSYYNEFHQDRAHSLSVAPKKYLTKSLYVFAGGLVTTGYRKELADVMENLGNGLTFVTVAGADYRISKNVAVTSIFLGLGVMVTSVKFSF